MCSEHVKFIVMCGHFLTTTAIHMEISSSKEVSTEYFLTDIHFLYHHTTKLLHLETYYKTLYGSRTVLCCSLPSSLAIMWRIRVYATRLCHTSVLPPCCCDACLPSLTWY